MRRKRIEANQSDNRAESSRCLLKSQSPLIRPDSDGLENGDSEVNHKKKGVFTFGIYFPQMPQ